MTILKSMTRRALMGIAGAAMMTSMMPAPSFAQDVTIPIIVKDTTSFYWQIVLAGARAAGKDLGEALGSALDDLDGFFTFVVGTKTGFGVLRDPIACKPAVMAETDRYVAFGSEYRALVNLPGIETARVWEPEPATVYFWDHEKAA